MEQVSGKSLRQFTYDELKGKKFLLHGRNNDDVIEATILKYSPSNKYVKVIHLGGKIDWRKSDELFIAEMLEDNNV